MSIFISIASYCDPLLTFTIERAARTARHPEWLHFGVVDQSPAGTPRLQAAQDSPAKLTYLRIDPVDARGPCWARALAMTTRCTGPPPRGCCRMWSSLAAPSRPTTRC